VSEALHLALIPAAGRGTRFYPLSRTVPKEMLPIGGLPMIHYAVEEAAAAGIEEIVVVIAPGKDIIRRYFTEPADPRGLPKGAGAAVDGIDPEARLAALQQRVSFSFVVQDPPDGLGGAILQARSVVRQRPFALLLPDYVWWGANPIHALRTAFEAEPTHLQGLMTLEGRHAHLFGNNGGVELEPLNGERYRVRALQEKGEGSFPLDPGERTIKACPRHIYLPDVFARLERLGPDRFGEKDDVPLLQELVVDNRLDGVLCEGRGLDVGNIQGLLAGNRWVDELGLPL